MFQLDLQKNDSSYNLVSNTAAKFMVFFRGFALLVHICSALLDFSFGHAEPESYKFDVQHFKIKQGPPIFN